MKNLKYSSIFLASYPPLFLVSCCLLLVASQAFASAPRFYLDQTNQAVAGETFSVKVLLDSDSPVNAYSVTLIYSRDLLELASFNNSRSIIEIWKSDPTVAAGEIKFSGGSLTPFKGKGGELITINFKALKVGAAGIAFGRSAIYLADGKGTEIVPEGGILHVAVGGPGTELAPANTPPDTAAPQIKFLSLEPDPFNKKQKFLTFLAADVGSGIKATEVRTMSFLWWSAWTPTENPAAVSASAWAVEFRARDNTNNIIDKVVYDWVALRKLVIASVAGIGAVLLAWLL